MKIYTSYFAMLRHLPENIIPISICGKAPQWYNGLQYKKLAPNYELLMKWKENHDNEYYIRCFNEQVLNTLNAQSIIDELCVLVNDSTKDICLICYEKPTDFCHRHLVADWLNANGFNVEEFIRIKK